MGEASRRRELSGVGVERHSRVSEVMERAWKLHRKNGHPDGYEGPCWGPTLSELEEVQGKIMSDRMSGKKDTQTLHSQRGCRCPKHRSTRHVFAECCREFAQKEAGENAGVAGDAKAEEPAGSGSGGSRTGQPVVRQAKRSNRRMVRNARRRDAK